MSTEAEVPQEQAAPEPVRVAMHMALRVTPEHFAETLVNGENSYEVLLEAIVAVDDRVGDWEFTFKLARRVLEMIVMAGEEEPDERLTASANDLLDYLDRTGR